MPRPKKARRTPDVLLRLTTEEREQLDAEVKRHNVNLSTYLRTLIEAAHRGDIAVPSTLFEHRL